MSLEVFEKLESKVQQAIDTITLLQMEIEELKEKNKGNDVEAIKAATDKVEKAFYAISEKLYKNAAPQEGAPTDGGSNDSNDSNGSNGSNGGNDGGVVDADFEEVND